MSDNSMEKIVSLCKRRGFIFPGSDIYGGLANTWDYGPLGIELKKNIMQAWWKALVQDRTDVVGLDAAILMHPKVWEASGHLEGFTDPLVDCKVCKRRFRADHLLEAKGIKPKFEPAGNIADPLYEQRNKTNKFQNTSTYLINTLDMANAQISNNTFTNHLIDLFDNNQDVKPDGESDDEIPENVINKTDGKFYDKLFNNDQQLSDIFLSQRTFVTQPITRIANQQQEFAEWLYGGSKYHEGPNICKTDQSKCLQYEDLRLSQRNY
jgi:hypothetical protein